MDSLLVLAVIGLAVWFWADSLRARERALKRSQALCKSVGAQLLDETVGLKRLGLKRGPGGHMQLKRGYQFEFSLNGTDRYQGTAVLMGGRVEYIHLDHPQGPIVTDADNVVPLRR